MRVEELSSEPTLVVRRQSLQPGESTDWHVDACRRFSVVVSGDRLSIEFDGHVPALDLPVHPGLADWDEPEPRVHRATNTGTMPYEEVVLFLRSDARVDPQPIARPVFDDLIRLVQVFNDCITANDLAGLESLVAPDHVFVDTAGKQVRGRDAVIRAWSGFFDAFPDYRNEFDAMVADGTIVRIRGRSWCNDPRLQGPALWRAVVSGSRLSEWQVFDDSAENRLLLGL